MHESKFRETIKNIGRVLGSNIISILSGVAVGLIIPKIFEVSDYGYYKTFNMYTAYVGVCSLGIADGVVLKYGGKDYEELDRNYFKVIFSWYTIIQICFAVIISLCGLYVKEKEYSFILFAVSIYVVTQNITGFFQQISQITQRFIEFSRRNLIKSALSVLIVAILWILYKIQIPIDYKLYIKMLFGMNVFLMVWYILTYRELVFVKNSKLYTGLKEIVQLSKLGFPLMFANLCSTLILIIDRQFVNIFFDTSTYARYAFAYNMLSLVTVATSAFATVLYPLLKRSSSETMANLYEIITSGTFAFMYAALSSFFLISVFIKWFLPNYTYSLEILRIIFPGLVLSTAITVIMHNYYKVNGDSLLFFKKSLKSLLISIVANVIAVLICRTTIAISVASIISLIIWYKDNNQYFKTKYQYKDGKNFGYYIVMMVVFYLTTLLDNYWMGFGIYWMAFSVISITFFRKSIRNVVIHVKKNKLCSERK